ncbi:hypothetical protein O3M35_003582 [Rhynocoris fuscipes]|uniref:Inhibitor of growth protein n=1 Tax=Rhynocoris fuscipes TaxID=488301 RepID=A0AAW1CKI8_9HEMI
MLNQAANDALYSATYVENYLDCVENLPDDVQRYLSRLHELDISYRGYLKDVDNYREVLENEDLEISIQRKTLYKLEQVLISLQEVGDEKVEIGQLINDLIDNKYRQLDQDLRNLDFYKVQEAAEANQPIKENVRESSASNFGGGNSGGNGAAVNGNCVGGERSSKRARRSRADVEVNDSAISETTRSKTSMNKSAGGSNSGSNHASGGNSGTGSNSGTNSGNTNSKKKKRKARQNQREETPPPLREEEVAPHDIDEPTYCLCDQISYGEMILCDNDLCPIEWFHFVCVSLTTKPKGKWFCPKCRGDRPNVMKPKSQFLKELERYNKEKEEKA